MDSNPLWRAIGRANDPLQRRLHNQLQQPHVTQSSLKSGNVGERIRLTSNYFPITTHTDWSFYKYAVDIYPVHDSINIARGLLRAHKRFLGTYIFDGTILFSRKKYKSDIVELSKQYKEKEMTITLNFISIIEKDDHAFIQILNLVLCNCLSYLNLRLFERNYYDIEAQIDVPKFKIHLLPGYKTNIGMCDAGLLLQTEILTKVIREETVLDFFIECSKKKLIDPNWMLTFKQAVIGSEVLTIHNNCIYRIYNVDEESGTEITFLKKDGSSISYIDYYKEKYGINISSQRQPMLISKEKKKSVRFEGEETELVYLASELCKMTGISNNMRKDNTLKDIEQYTNLNPTERTKKCNKFLERLLTTPGSAELLTQWNLTISNELITFSAHKMAQETLYGHKHDYLSGTTANWTAKLRSLPMYSCAKISCWVIVTPYMWSSNVGPFTNTILKAANNIGFELPTPKIVEIDDTNIETYSINLERLINEINPSLILCIIISEKKDIYNIIKRKLCVDRAVPSQIVLLRQVQKNNMSVCTKIAIQINCKLGGAPWRVGIPEKGMMIIGFDVCHDKQNKNKSFGALIATMNDEHTSYFSCVEPYKSEQELSTSFATSICKALTKYKIKNGKLPNTILIYRDGVEDGQLLYVRKIEVAMVKKTCEDFYREQKVGLAFIIVKKCSSTRFFFKNNQNYDNLPPGTIIDNSVTDPTMYDFYLVSQHEKQGTVRPTYYNVVFNTLNETASITFRAGHLQKLTFKLTHMYYNWSGTVRVPAPCQMAHKLAFLTGQSLQTNPNPGLEDLLYFL